MGVLPGARQEHRYQTCRDGDCRNYICRIYKEGYEAGHGAGFGAGVAEGRAEGFAEGYAEGCASSGE